MIVGVVANLCCQGEGCERVVGCSSLLHSCLALLHSTDDVPTLVEAFRLLRLLLWHVTFRLPPKERSRCPLIIALRSNEVLKEALVFMLKNSLSGRYQCSYTVQYTLLCTLGCLSLIMFSLYTNPRKSTN